MTDQHSVGVVLIGRNEGARLIGCLASIPDVVSRVIYVDSGSTDGSIETATKAGAKVVQLDTSRPFTAARARNAGYDALVADGTAEFVQFVDGDCELHPDWIETARAFLQKTPEAAVVCGRRRERFPEATVYNRLCDSEWNTPIGQAKACGGDAMMRSQVFDDVGKYDPTLIAGEEPELCVRIRRTGAQVWRIDHEMTLHDAAMTKLGQWWKRMRRAGHAAAEAAVIYGGPDEPEPLGARRRALVWGLFLPLAILLGTAFTPYALLALLAYPAQVTRLAMREGPAQRGSWENAFFMTLGKFPDVIGVVEYHWRKLRRKPSELIEYK